MSSSLKRGYAALLMIQFWIVFFGVILAPNILQALGFFEAQTFVFRLAIIGANIQAFVLLTILILLYFDLRGCASIVTASFLVSNLVFTLITIKLGFPFYGYGFLFSNLVALLISMSLLYRQFSKLEYLIFTRQPIAAK